MSAEEQTIGGVWHGHERCSDCARKEANMHPDVRRARIAHLQAEMALTTAIRRGAADEVVPLAEHKADCVDDLISTINRIDPTYFDLPRVPCSERKECQ